MAEQRRYADLSDAEKLAHWQRFVPATAEEASWKRKAIRQFKAEVRRSN
jgi:hypothetical protein